jgi:hypothetical protein
MNYFSSHKKKFAAKWLCVLLALFALPLNAPAQPTTPERWLFVFDLSATMKKRLPATEETLKNFLASAAEGRLQTGDNIGVWTYDQKTHGGQFPLAIWDPKQATPLTTNLMTFLRSQTYTASSQLATLQPSLNGVVTNSERLTVIIFCDGESDLMGTPYDRGVNQSFLDGRAERKKNAQPFVVLIRTLSGKPIGCTVNFPPGAINIPLFLAPPTPPAVALPPVVVAPIKPPPPAVIPDLVIVGTHVSTATNAAPETPAASFKTVSVEPPKIVTPAVKPAALATNSQPVITRVTNAAVAKVELPAAAATSNPIAINNNNSATGTRRLVWVGFGVLAAVIALVVVLVIRPGRRPQSSLITSSMQDDPRRK